MFLLNAQTETLNAENGREFLKGLPLPIMIFGIKTFVYVLVHRKSRKSPPKEKKDINELIHYYK